MMSILCRSKHVCSQRMFGALVEKAYSAEMNPNCSTKQNQNRKNSLVLLTVATRTIVYNHLILLATIEQLQLKRGHKFLFNDTQNLLN